MSQQIVGNFRDEDARYCRLCLVVVKDNFKELFPLIDLTVAIVDILEILTNVNILKDDTFSQLVCLDCWQTLIEIKNFKTIVQESDLKLKSELTDKHPLTTDNNLCSNNVEEVESKLIVEANLEEEIVDEKVDIDQLNLTEIKQEFDSANEIVEDELMVKVNHCEIIETDPFSMLENEPSSNIQSAGGEKIVKLKLRIPRKKFRCSICSREFSKSYNLTQHLRTHRSKRCDVCNFLSKGRYALNKHKLRHRHEKNFECQTCGMVLSTKPLWIKHLQTHIKCEKCNKIFETTEALLVHDKFMHPVEETNTHCEQCNENFETSTALNGHIKIIHTTTPGLCDICGEYVPTNILVHIKECNIRPFKCDICNLSFGRKKYLKEHLNQHPNKKYKCEICGKVLSTELTLYCHKREIHNDNKRFKCDQCGKQFHFKNRLVRHMHIHLNTKKR